MSALGISALVYGICALLMLVFLEIEIWRDYKCKRRSHTLPKTREKIKDQVSAAIFAWGWPGAIVIFMLD